MINIVCFIKENLVLLTSMKKLTIYNRLYHRHGVGLFECWIY